MKCTIEDRRENGGLQLSKQIQDNSGIKQSGIETKNLLYDNFNRLKEINNESLPVSDDRTDQAIAKNIHAIKE